MFLFSVIFPFQVPTPLHLGYLVLQFQENSTLLSIMDGIHKFDLDFFGYSLFHFDIIGVGDGFTLCPLYDLALQ